MIPLPSGDMALMSAGRPFRIPQGARDTVSQSITMRSVRNSGQLVLAGRSGLSAHRRPVGSSLAGRRFSSARATPRRRVPHSRYVSIGAPVADSGGAHGATGAVPD